MNINDYIEKIIKTEGGYSNNPSDPGGETCWGWTEKNARCRGYTGDMKSLPKEIAHQWYLEDFWQKPKLGLIDTINSRIAHEILDSGVNCGLSRAIRWLQRAINALNRGSKDYSDINVDGVMGKNTAEALTVFLDKRGDSGEVVLLRCLNGLQVAHYVKCAEHNEKLEDFFYGWILNRVVM